MKSAHSTSSSEIEEILTSSSWRLNSSSVSLVVREVVCVDADRLEIAELTSVGAVEACGAVLASKMKTKEAAKMTRID